MARQEEFSRDDLDWHFDIPWEAELYSATVQNILRHEAVSRAGKLRWPVWSRVP
jgi:hypothetical protein